MKPPEQEPDVLAYVQALEDLSLRTAGIAIDGQASGTGVLVAEDLVLTAAHVINARRPPTISKSIVTVFDLIEQPGREKAEIGIRVPVAQVVYWSPPTTAEVSGTAGEDWNAAPENLDFALLRLAWPVPAPAGSKTAGGTASRGYYILRSDVHEFEYVSTLIVAQYRLGGFLRISHIEQPPKLNRAGTRIRYRCNTLLGSSGAPIVDTEGRLVAIHHYHSGGVSQGIPISAIAQNLVSSRADLFGEVAYERFERTSRPLSVGKSVFVSYSHKDERYRNGLDVALASLRHNGEISFWYDGKILPGQEWGREIDKNLENANIILLLVSFDFIASDYAYGEMKRALERHKSGSATVVPIIIRDCDWQNSPIRVLQALPKEGRPVKSWSNRDKAWLDVTQGLRRIITNRERLS
jgi:TIR domain/Trypsin-like peptidase domain